MTVSILAECWLLHTVIVHCIETEKQATTTTTTTATAKSNGENQAEL